MVPLVLLLKLASSSKSGEGGTHGAAFKARLKELVWTEIGPVVTTSSLGKDCNQE